MIVCVIWKNIAVLQTETMITAFLSYDLEMCIGPVFILSTPPCICGVVCELASSLCNSMQQSPQHIWTQTEGKVTAAWL